MKITSAKLKNSEFQDTIIESLILEINGVGFRASLKVILVLL